jgi:hypothetical protein
VTDPATPKTPLRAASAAQAREDRLAQALRANLKRRKAAKATPPPKD